MRGHYMVDQHYLSFSDSVPAVLRSDLLKSCDFTCSMCGIGPGQFDPETGYRAILHIHRLTVNDGRQLGAICSICLEGRREAGLA